MVRKVKYATQQVGEVTVYDHAKSFHGFTLLAPIGSKEIFLVDMEGEAVHTWALPLPVAGDSMFLANGRLLYCARAEEGPLPGAEGAAGAIIELDWDANIAWRFDDPCLHHSFARTENGNTLALRWVHLPEECRNLVLGGIPLESSTDLLWSDSIIEVNQDGGVVWEWKAYEHLDPDRDTICPHCVRRHWPNLTSCDVLPSGDVVTSLHNLHNLAIIEKKSGDVRWRWGLGEIAHASGVAVLPDGHVLVLDNGMHTYYDPMGFSRVLEIDPETSDIQWVYEDVPRSNFYTSIHGNGQRLPNLNTLVCDATEGRIFEVTPLGEKVWEFRSCIRSDSPLYGLTNYLFRAYRYGPDYPGLPGNIPVGSIPAPESGEMTEDMPISNVLQRRLESLGY